MNANAERIERGAEAIRAWMGVAGSRPAYGIRNWPLETAAESVDPKGENPEILVDVQTEAAEYIGDVLADILHFAETCGVDTQGVIDRALGHFEAER